MSVTDIETVSVALVAHVLKRAPPEGASLEEKRCQGDGHPDGPPESDRVKSETSKTILCKPRRQVTHEMRIDVQRVCATALAKAADAAVASIAMSPSMLKYSR